MYTFKMKKVIAIVVAILLVGICFAGCVNNPNTNKFKVMFPEGEGYTVKSSPICYVEKGGTVVFELDILESYSIKSCNIGEFLDGILEIKNINRSATVRLVCDKKVNVEVSAVNGLIKAEPIDTQTFVLGSTILVTVEPFSNYDLDKFSLNDVEQEFETDFQGNLSLLLTLSEDLSINAVCVGDQYMFSYSVKGGGEVQIQDSEYLDNIGRKIIHYGDEIAIKLIPFEGHKVNFVEIGGRVSIPASDTFNLPITENISFTVYFSDTDDVKIIYHENGGEKIGDILDLAVPIDDYLNIDHCYGKLNREGWTLTGFNTLPDGSGKSYNLGALLKMTKDTILYAEWEKQTDADYIVFEQSGDNYVVAGLSSSGLAMQIRKIVIPDSYYGKPVTAIKQNAFEGNLSIKEIVMHNGITSVGANAFRNCISLNKLVVTENIIDFDISAIDGCDALETIRFNNTTDSLASNYHGMPSYRFAALAAPDRAPMYIVIAGSSGTYGIDSALFNSEMDMDIIVVGVTVQIGIYPLLSIVSNFIVEGDIVILAPEYNTPMFGVCYGDTNYIRQMSLKNTFVFENMNYADNNQFFDYLLPNLSSFKNFAEGSRYPEDLMDDYGALTVLRPNNTPDYRLAIQKDEFNADLISDHAFDFLQKINFKLIENNAQMFFSFAPYNINGLSVPFEDSKTDRQACVDLLVQKLQDIPLISKIDNYFLEGQYFFDSNYHLSTEGTQVRTARLITDIKAQLAKDNKI